jgi:hypothetical protein
MRTIARWSGAVDRCMVSDLALLRHACPMTWRFRVRADIRETSKLDCASPEWVIEDGGPGQQVKLVTRDPRSPNPVPLSEARSITLRGSGYNSEDEAMAAGQLWRARLMRAFATVRIGADFGDRAPQGAFTTEGLSAFGPEGRRILNDVHGLMTFECEPAPIFLGMGPITGMVSSPHERLVQAMTSAIENGGLSEERQVAYDLFAASFGQRSADARFALLMMALESLIGPEPRLEDSRRYVQSMIDAAERSGLAKSEIASITGALSWLLNESIGQAGRRLAKTLEPKKYKNERPATFFTHCYEMRSRLMHGHHPLPTRHEIGAWAAPLQVFVADLLSGEEATRDNYGPVDRPGLSS